MMNRFLAPVLTICIIILDQWTKYLVRQEMQLGQSIPIISDRFHLTYIENNGVAFGMFAGHTSWFVILGVIVLLGLWIFVWKEQNRSICLHVGSALITAGAIGNMIDRAYKASVTDMFDFRIWPVFNVADIAVCVGFFLLIVYIIRDTGEKNER